MVVTLSVKSPESSAKIKSGLPGTAILAKFMTTFRVRLAVFVDESEAVTTNATGDDDPMAVQSDGVSE